jgi:plastocyanin
MRYLTTLLVLVLALAACGDDDTTAETTAASATTAAPIAADAASLTISGFDFGDPITVPIGTEVTITNQDGAGHTWTSNDGLWDSGSLSGGDSFSFTFTDAGEFDFFCGIHASMTGSITVTG